MKQKVLVLANFEIFFIRDDTDIIRSFAPTEFYNTTEQGLISFRLLREIFSCSHIYIWFASAHSLFPALLSRMFGKKVIVVSGGYDTARVGEINYGHAGNGLKGIVSKLVLKFAQKVIVNSKHSEKEMLNFYPGAKKKLAVIPHRIKHREPSVKPERDPKLFITVIRMNKMNYYRKKVSLLKEIAKRMPEFNFRHIGLVLPEIEQEFNNNRPDNFISVGHQDEEQLWEWYYKASLLLAPSWHEGFGLTTVEALAGGCISVISGAGAQDEVTLGEAVIIESDDPDEWVKTLKNFSINASEREQKRKKILDFYKESNRVEQLKKVFEETGLAVN